MGIFTPALTDPVFCGTQVVRMVLTYDSEAIACMAQGTIHVGTGGSAVLSIYALAPAAAQRGSTTSWVREETANQWFVCMTDKIDEASTLCRTSIGLQSAQVDVRDDTDGSMGTVFSCVNKFIGDNITANSPARWCRGRFIYLPEKRLRKPQPKPTP